MPQSSPHERLKELVTAIAASPLPMETKERLLDVIDIASPEELEAMHVAFRAADLQADKLEALMERIDATVRTLRHDMYQAMDAEQEALIREYSSDDPPVAG